MSRLNRASWGGLLALAALASAGCHMGPVALRSNRTLYNLAVQETANEQLLLNIVRLKYREPMSFLEVNAINTNFKFNLSGSAQAISPTHEDVIVNGISGGSRTGSLTGTYSEEPTFSYSPIQGEQFAKRIVGDIDLSTLALLLRGGWRVDVIMRLLVDRVEDLRNDPTTVHPSSEKASSYDRFIELCRLWRKLQKRGDLAVTIKVEDEVAMDPVPAEQVTAAAILTAEQLGFRFVMRSTGGYELRRVGQPTVVVEARYIDANEIAAANALLGVPPKGQDGAAGPVIQKYRLRKPGGLRTATAPTGDIAVQVRSFVNVLFYIAQGAEVPESHEKAGIVKAYMDEAGNRIDRRKCISDLLNVRCSLAPPAHALTAVFYRGCWFYVDDTEVPSKDSFAMLGYVFALQAGEVKSNAPVLTLPIGK